MHKLELLKALREHGQTIRKMAEGGAMDPTALSGPQEVGQGSSAKQGGIFGGIGNLLGTQNSFSASGAPIQAGTNSAQLNNSYQQAQSGLSDQQNFLQALQSQNGVQNQSNVFNQIQDVAQGRGPNPAVAMLNQQTGQNVANQAALMASQRGAGANVGLMARLASQQGAQTQQNAIGQAAGLQAQQQLTAQQQLAQIAQNQVNQQGQAVQGYNSAAQNEQNILQGANSAFNNSSVGMQSNINTVNAGVSAGNQSAGNGLIGGILGGASSALSGLFHAEGGEVSHGDGVPAPRAYAEGGETAPAGSDMRFALQSPVLSQAPGAPGAVGPKSNVGRFLNPAPPQQQAAPVGVQDGGLGGGNFLQAGFSTGVNNLLSALRSKDAGNTYNMSNDQADESYLDADAYLNSLNPQGAMGPQTELDSKSGTEEELSASEPDPFMRANQGGGVSSKLKKGGSVPGKAPVGGKVNTLKNDTVPALLSAGEIVLPRSVTKSADPVQGAADFVAAIMRKKGKAA